MGSRPCNFIKETRNNLWITMFNARILIATFVFSCVILECYSFKCYGGEYMPRKNTMQEQTEEKPKLFNCPFSGPVVCVSRYVRTDVISRKGTLLAGGWSKGCEKKGGPDLFELFGDDRSVRCVEQKEGTEYIKSGKLIHCICSTEECNGGIHTV